MALDWTILGKGKFWFDSDMGVSLFGQWRGFCSQKLNWTGVVRQTGRKTEGGQAGRQGRAGRGRLVCWAGQTDSFLPFSFKRQGPPGRGRQLAGSKFPSASPLLRQAGGGGVAENFWAGMAAIPWAGLHIF